jgi:hypothetical protein
MTIREEIMFSIFVAAAMVMGGHSIMFWGKSPRVKREARRIDEEPGLLRVRTGRGCF